MPIIDCFKNTFYIILHSILCFTGCLVLAISIIIIYKLTCFNQFTPSIVFGPPILIIILIIILMFGFYKGYQGILQKNWNFILILCLFIISNSILDIIIGLWSISIRDGIYNQVNNTMEQLFINYTKLSYKKEAWNNVQEQLKCCGIKGAQSFIEAGFDSIPISCCTFNEKNIACESGYFKDNCIHMLTSYINEQLYYFIVLILCFVIVQILAVGVCFDFKSKINAPPPKDLEDALYTLPLKRNYTGQS